MVDPGTDEPPRAPAGGAIAVLVPVKSFSAAKLRLAPALDGAARSRLAREMADRVLDAADGLHVAVVCDTAEVAAWATSRAADVVWAPGLGLNGAVDAGVRALRAEGFARALVAHGDLPFARHLGNVDRGGVTAVPDRRRDGTNVLCVPTPAGFRFAYGTGSFDRHVLEARRLGLPLTVVDDPQLAFDVDVPADLAVLRAGPGVQAGAGSAR